MASERVRLGGLPSQVKPTFMLPALGTALAGAVLAPSVDPLAALAHALAVGAALYTAHLVDEYVDAHVRGEDVPSVPVRVLRPAVAGASLVFWGSIAVLWVAGHVAGVIATVPLWVLGLLHAPALDRHPVAVTVDYPAGIALALVGGFLVQTGRLTPGVSTIAVALAVVLAGVTVAVDDLDRSFDRTVAKRTVPVVLGPRGAAVIAAGAQVLAALLVAAVAVAGTLPPTSLLAVPWPLVGAAVALWGSGRRAVHVQMGLVYPFAAVLVGAQCVATGCAAVRAVPVLAA